MKAIIDLFLNSLLLPVLEIVLPILATALAGLLTLWITRLAAKAKIQLNAEQEAVLRQRIRGAVLHTNQTLVKNLRAAKADGKLTREEAVAALSATVRTATKDLGKNGLATLAAVTGKGETALREVVEEEVAAVKLIPKS